MILIARCALSTRLSPPLATMYGSLKKTICPEPYGTSTSRFLPSAVKCTTGAPGAVVSFSAAGSVIVFAGACLTVTTGSSFEAEPLPSPYFGALPSPSSSSSSSGVGVGVEKDFGVVSYFGAAFEKVRAGVGLGV